MKFAALIALIFAIVVIVLPQDASAFSLVPCGRATPVDAQGKPLPPQTPDQEPCDFRDLVGILMRMINYLISVAGIVAMYNILGRGWDLMTSLGNVEKIQRAKEGISNAVVGFAMIILSFVLINLVVNGLLGNPDQSAKQRPWWDPKCIFNITNPDGCSLSMFGPKLAHAQQNDGSAELNNPLKFGNVEFKEPSEIVRKGFQGFAGVIGIVAIAFIVFSGFKLVIATEEEAINSAKQSLTWAVGGFVVALLAFTLISSTANLIGFDPGRIPIGEDRLQNPVPGKGGVAGADFFEVLGNLMINVLGLLGFATTLMIIYYGYRYITAAGNEESIEKAKTGLKWAIVGFVVSLLAFTIVSVIRQNLVFGTAAQQTGGTGNNNQPPAGQTAALSAKQDYDWTIPKIGYVRQADGRVAYTDFAMTVLSTNTSPTQVSITIADDQGSAFINNPVRKTLNTGETLLYAGLEHYPLEAGANYGNVSVRVDASAPVYVLSPEVFRAAGTGNDVLGAVKDGWWLGGSWSMEVPSALEGNTVYFPYYIHWHNFENWPEGWDTLITLRNNSPQAGAAKVEARAEYNTIWGDKTQCLVKPIGYGQSGQRKSKTYTVPPLGTHTISVKDTLGISVDQSHHSEGSLAVVVPDSGKWQVSAKVVSYPDGTKICDAPKS